MERADESPEANPYEPPKRRWSGQRRLERLFDFSSSASSWYHWPLCSGGCTACNRAMNADNGDVIESTVGGGLVAGVIAILLLFMVGSSRRP